MYNNNKKLQANLSQESKERNKTKQKTNKHVTVGLRKSAP